MTINLLFKILSPCYRISSTTASISDGTSSDLLEPIPATDEGNFQSSSSVNADANNGVTPHLLVQLHQITFIPF